MRDTTSETPALEMTALNRAAEDISRRVAPGVLGAGLMNLENGQSWAFNGDRPFPMQSVFKLPLAAAVLAEIEAGRLTLDERLVVRPEDLSPPYSPIADAWPGRADYTVAEMLNAAVRDSDNTAADMLMRRIGGPGAVTAWLVDKGVTELRIDRYERQLQTEFFGMDSFREAWRGREKFLAAKNAIDPAARRSAVVRYLSDPRDTATPRGMLDFLYKLDDGLIIGPVVRERLFAMMTGGRVTSRLAAAMPAGASLLHKTGSSWTEQGLNAATNDVGLITLADGRRYAAAVFLSGASLDDDARDAAIAELGRGMIKSLG
ncbi:class A beta-lactamase [Phenylobacterium immobile]|uniref:class A beta-lactamase n=1 Tax=Phenylobacterium immobile TaxID=21 RepID=UPI000AD68CBB|nr:class A beta-lactamase [Phenylobacterium immobile]